MAKLHDETVESRPSKLLSEKRIVVTRARAQAGALAVLIEELGGEVIEFPTIDIQPPESFAVFDAAVGNIESYDWLFFTSVNSVEPFLSRLRLLGKDLASLAQLKIGAIGSETAKKLTRMGMKSSLVPERFQAEGILDAVNPELISGKRVLIPRAAAAREVLPETLRAWGASVDVVIAYRAAVPATPVAPLKDLLDRDRVDVITFTSSSTVRNFVYLLGPRPFVEIIGNSAIACIGPITAQTVAELGGHADIVAREFTIAGLTAALAEHFNPEREIRSSNRGRSGR